MILDLKEKKEVTATEDYTPPSMDEIRARTNGKPFELVNSRYLKIIEEEGKPLLKEEKDLIKASFEVL